MNAARAVVIGLSVAAGIACGGAGSGASTETPSGTIALFIEVLEHGDVDGYIALLPEEDRHRAQTSRRAAGERFDDSLKTVMASLKEAVAGGEVIGEDVSGDRALVRVRNRSGAEVTWRCVREPDGWKVAVGG